MATDWKPSVQAALRKVQKNIAQLQVTERRLIAALGDESPEPTPKRRRRAASGKLTVRAAVLDAVREAGSEGMAIDDIIKTVTKIRPQTPDVSIYGRRTELMQEGLLTCIGKKYYIAKGTLKETVLELVTQAGAAGMGAVDIFDAIRDKYPKTTKDGVYVQCAQWIRAGAMVRNKETGCYVATSVKG